MKLAMEFRFVYVTCRDADEAWAVAEAVVGAQLAACANVLPGMQSLYWWEGKLVRDTEVVLVLKTKAAHMQALVAAVEAAHSYAVPCVVALPILEGNPAYLRWLDTSC
jgi:periplasmic divalent cation tolerance protein